jgi:hypothetical protein
MTDIREGGNNKSLIRHLRGGRPMNERFEEIKEYLRRLSVCARHASDEAEAKIRAVNTWVCQLGELGFLNDTVILGPVILSRGYEPRPGDNDSGQLVQAALCVPRVLASCTGTARSMSSGTPSLIVWSLRPCTGGSLSRAASPPSRACYSRT